MGCDLTEGVFVRKVVPRIHEHNILAGAHCNTAIHCIVNTRVRLGYPAGDGARRILKKLGRAVRRTTIDDDPFERLESLCLDTTPCGMESLQVVEYHRDDREGRA